MKGYETINWLVAGVMLKRDFALKIEVCGLDQALEKCPYDDLTDEQRGTFEAAMKQPILKAIVRTWWLAYDNLRDSGAIPPASTKSPWWP